MCVCMYIQVTVQCKIDHVFHVYCDRPDISVVVLEEPCLFLAIGEVSYVCVSIALVCNHICV